MPLGRKESAGAVAAMEDAFERYKKHLDDVLTRTWDWRHSMKAIGKPHPLDDWQT